MWTAFRVELPPVQWALARGCGYYGCFTHFPSDEPFGDEPFGDEPFGDEPFGDEPFRDEPFGEPLKLLEEAGVDVPKALTAQRGREMSSFSGPRAMNLRSPSSQALTGEQSTPFPHVFV